MTRHSQRTHETQPNLVSLWTTGTQPQLRSEEAWITPLWNRHVYALQEQDKYSRFVTTQEGFLVHYDPTAFHAARNTGTGEKMDESHLPEWPGKAASLESFYYTSAKRTGR